MTYSIENVSASSEQEMCQFLKEQEDYTLFLLNNFENYGATLTQEPFSGNYKLIRDVNKIIAVFYLNRNGTLLIETTIHEPLFDVILHACQQELTPLKGVIGNWTFCKPFWEYLKAKKIIQTEIFTSKEILYNIDLTIKEYSPQPNVRLLKDSDYDQWKPLRLDYIIEQGTPHDLSDHQLKELFLDRVKKKIIWGFFLQNKLVSVADLNAKTSDLGQVGGVYTQPNFRQKGYSKSVMQQLMVDAKNLLKIRKLIIFTGEKNFPAQKVYQSLGASQVGYYALFFGKPD